VGFLKRVIFLVGSYYINTEDNYARLIDFLSQISKLFNFNVLDLADFMMHHWFPFVFLCWYSRTPVLAICVSFRASSSVGSTGGLIIIAHTSPYLFFLISNCTYNSHIIRQENFLAYFMCILNSCVIYKFETVNPGCPPSQQNTFCSTTIRWDIRAALYFCSCELPWRSTECVLLPCFNALPDIFVVMNCSVLGYRW